MTRPNQVCAPHTLIAAAAEFGKAARVPVTWLVAANDTYFSPDLSRRMADAFRAAAARSSFASGGVRQRGTLAGEVEAGVRIAGPELDRALKPSR